MEISKSKEKIFLEKYNHIMFVLSYCKDKVVNKTLSEKENEMYLSLLESYTSDILEIMGYDKKLKNDIRERSKSLREANLKIRDLEKQLGQKVSMSDIVYGFEAYSKEIKDWWKEEGFISFKPFSLTNNKVIEVDLSLTPHKEYNSMFKSNIESENEKLKEKDEINFKKLSEKYDFSNFKLVDNDKNRNLLFSVILNKFPNVIFKELKTSKNKDGTGYITDISFIITFHNIQIPTFG